MKNFWFLCLFLLPLALFGQKSTVRGYVYDKVTAEPIPFASVKLDGTAYGANTDLTGFFTVSAVPVGDYKVVVSFLGYADYSTTVTLQSGKIEFVNIYLEEDKNELKEVVISGKKEQAKTQTQVSKLTVTPKQIRALPSTGGEADIAQYLTVLPGVVFTGDQGGQLYIRGGSPVQNKILLDGMTIYNPFHSIGFFSVFETETIRNVDVLTGGFGAEYGNRISAIVDVKTREGNRKKLGGMVSASPFQVKGILEGPIVPLKGDNGSSISFLLTGKRGLIDQTSKQLYSYVNDSVGIPFNYQDFYGKLSFLAGNGSKINAFGFKYDDGVKYPATDFSWNSTGGGVDFTLIPVGSNTIVSGVFTYSGYDSKIAERDGKPRSSGISGLYANLNFNTFGRNSEFKYGLEANGFSTDFTFVNFKNLTIEQKENTTEVAGYLKYKQKIGSLVLEPSFRLQYYNSLSEVSPEPRLGLKLNITDDFRFKAAGGMYSQNLLSTVNERDIVNLFVGFLSGPEGAIYEPGTTDRVSSKLQKSIHGVVGFEKDINKNVEVNLEGYYKKFTQLISLNRNKQLPSDPDYIKETGDAYGIDFTTKVELKKAYIWATYSLGYVNRDDGEQVYPPVFDRRHNANLLATYQLGKNNVWELGARWNFGSGFPFTQTQGFHSSFNFDDGINTDITGGNPDLGIIYADVRNGGRLPYYHRLDVSAKRRFDFSKNVKMEVTASCSNVYDRPNIFYFDRINYERVNQLPILPSLSVSLEF